MAMSSLLLSLCLLTAALAAPDYPFWDPKLDWDTRVDDLVKRLTLAEIAPQSEAVYGSYTPAIERLGIKPYVWITECLHGQVSTNTTSFPQALGMAASFSTALIRNVSEAISNEVRGHWNTMSAAGVYSTMNGLSCFSPVINIMRHPLWGRNQESYGEDPYLSGQLVTQFVHGLQGDDKRYVRANAGCKHFDVHAGPENIPVNRASFDAKVSTRDWRMTFLPAFKACVEAGTYSLMCSYNRINGVPACANKELLTSITREEWGFKGYVVSDAGAIVHIITEHHYLNNSVDTAAAAIKAGCNLELNGNDHIYKSQLDALKQGKITEQELRDNVKPLFYTRMRLGEFDPPSMNPYSKIDMSVVQSQEHRDLALRAAQMSLVLLKNDGILPLSGKRNKVAIVGPFANNQQQQTGDYGSNILNQFTTTPVDSLAALGDTHTTHPGCDNTHCQNYNSGAIQAAVSDADLIIVCLGTGQAVESEGNDRASLALPGHQLELLDDAINSSPFTARLIVLLFNAGPLDVTYAKNNPDVSAMVACFFPAQSTGAALYNVLTNQGDYGSPAGRLPATWPASMEQVPPMVDYTMVGRTYRYFQGDPLYPFGYGLSYTKFQYSGLSVQPYTIIGKRSYKIMVSVQNVGRVMGDEVTQIYMSWPANVTITPKLQLVGFLRASYNTNYQQTYQFILDEDQMAVWIDDTRGFIVPSGEYTIYAGGQQPNQKMNVGSNILQTTFTY